MIPALFGEQCDPVEVRPNRFERLPRSAHTPPLPRRDFVPTTLSTRGINSRRGIFHPSRRTPRRFKGRPTPSPHHGASSCAPAARGGKDDSRRPARFKVLDLPGAMISDAPRVLIQFWQWRHAESLNAPAPAPSLYARHAPRTPSGTLLVFDTNAYAVPTANPDSPAKPLQKRGRARDAKQGL